MRPAAGSEALPSPDDGQRGSTLDDLSALLDGRTFAVLSGAGISTESGIPDYRSPESLRRRHQPLMYREYVGSAAARRRYWARGSVGWRAMGMAEPNDGHRAVAQLEEHGLTTGLITQNVDGLHQKAGSRNLVELHGSLSRVRCLNCGNVYPRERMHRAIRELNPDFVQESFELTPDGDAIIPDEAIEGFEVPPCPNCGGVLKADVVFFGENVPRERVERAMGMVDAAESLLVVGSSLAVLSGLRFVHRAADAGKPVAIVNDGPTRGDDLATIKLEGRLGVLLPALASELTGAAAPGRNR